MLVECCYPFSLEYGNETWDCNKSQENLLYLGSLGKFLNVLLELEMRLLGGHGLRYFKES